jgi:Tfp pilus assembly protein PilN
MSNTSVETTTSLTTGHALPRVNLLPPEVHQARKLRKLQLGLGAGVAVVAVILGGLYVMQSRDASTAADQLATVQAQTTTLNTQKAQYADVPRTLGQIEAAEDARQAAMGNDVSWYRYLNDLTYITPKNVWLDGVTVTFSGSSSGSTSTASTASTTGSTTTPGIATITFAGHGYAHNDVAAWLDAVAKEKGWTDAYFTNSKINAINNHKTVDFTSSVTVTAKALSHRYDRKAG